MKGKAERRRRRRTSRASSSSSSSSSCSSSSSGLTAITTATDMSKVLQKRHMEDVRKCCLALGDPREHERSGLQLGTRAGNNFFHFLAENIILQSGKASKALSTAQGGNHSSVEGGKGSYQKRKAITYTSKINVRKYP